MVTPEAPVKAVNNAQAAKETTSLIEDSIKKVATGTDIANETAKALEQIVDQIDGVSTLVESIAVASNEQAQGVDQINVGIGQIANVVQSTSATSEETAAASEELSSQAELLKQLVARFKLKDQNNKMASSYDTPIDRGIDLGESRPVKQLPLKKKTISLSDDEFDKY